MSGCRVLVTGHRGFLGQHLVAELEGAGYEVVGHDRKEGDLTFPGMLDRRLLDVKPDRVIHLAAQVGRLFGEDDLRRTVQANATMTTLLARACGTRGIPVLYASTSEVYGNYGRIACHEDSPCRPPHNLYGLTKRWGEEVLRLYAPERLRIVRLSMPYGPGAPPGRGRRAMDTFLWQAQHRKSITVHRGAERSWCHVSDTVRGMRFAMERGSQEAYNVGRNDRPTTMLALAEWACDHALASRSLIREVDPPEAQTVVKRLATDRLYRLGWRPRVELVDGLLEMYEWVRRFDAKGHLIASDA